MADGKTVVQGLYPNRYSNYRDDQEAREAEDELAARLGSGEQWEDPDFPPTGDSIYLDPFDPPKGGLPPSSFEWLRINSLEVAGMADPKTFALGEMGQTRGELVQGALGDGWLLSAFTVLGRDPKALSWLFVSERHRRKGLYTLKILKAGQWRYVHVDDRIPCTRAGKPYFVRSRDLHEAWPLLLEKGYAKLHGCYEALGGGRVEDALKDLLDMAVVKIQTGRTTVPLSPPVPCDPNNLQALSQSKRGEGEGGGGLFDLIARSLQNSGHVCISSEPLPPLDNTGSGGRKNGSSGGGDSKGSGSLEKAAAAALENPAAPAKGRAKGLLALRTCSVVEARRFYAEPTEDRDGEHVFLLKVCNPWGEGGYRGPWSSADDAKWDAYPKLKADFFPPPSSSTSTLNKAGPTEAHSFYMTYQEMLHNFNTVYLINGPGENGVRYTYHGRWLPGDPKSDAGGCPLYPSFGKNPQYALTLHDPRSTLHVNLGQYDHRWQEAQPPLKKYDSMIGFFLVRLKGVKRRQGRFHSAKVVGKCAYFHNARHASGIFPNLPPGRYAIVPCTYIPSPEMERFVLEVTCDTRAEAEQHDGGPADTDDRESDDEGLEEERLTDRTFGRVSEASPIEDASERVYQSLQLQVSDLSHTLWSLKQHVEVLESSLLSTLTPPHA